MKGRLRRWWARIEGRSHNVFWVGWLVFAGTFASLITLWTSVQSIQSALPVSHLMKERDFSALQLDISRVHNALLLYTAAPDAQRLTDLQLAVDFVVTRARDNRRIYQDVEPDLAGFHDAIQHGVERLDQLLDNPADGTPQALIQLAARLTLQIPTWTELQSWAKDMNNQQFQASIDGATRQRDHLASLRVLLGLFVLLTAVGAAALVALLVRQQKANHHLRSKDQEIRELAFLDPLTRLANRRLLFDRLHHALQTSTRTGRLGALMYMDLDHFKNLNDTQGHDAGDALLRQVAFRLLEVVRGQDTVARLGGDEFVVLLEDLGPDEEHAIRATEVVVDKVRLAFEAPFELGLPNTLLWRKSVSVGVTLFGGPGYSVETVIKQADMALYQAKDAGRDAVRYFNPQMQKAVEHRARLERELRQALVDAHFRVHFQPVVNPQGRLLGAEALLRWWSPQNELVSPGAFMGVAEDSGLVLELGEWVLHTACAQWARWHHHHTGAPLRLSVNISPKQLRQPDIVERIQNALKTSGLPPEQLTLELTETVVLSNLQDSEAKMRALRDLGVRLSLDDFGTGYSSLTYVQQLPFTEIKIDRSFVQDVGKDANDEAICAAIVGLARNLRLHVVVEGVETPEQVGFFTEAHPCDALQGYFFGRPCDATAFVQRWGVELGVAPQTLPLTD